MILMMMKKKKKSKNLMTMSLKKMLLSVLKLFFPLLYVYCQIASFQVPCIIRIMIIW